MQFELFIALRYLFARKGLISVASALAAVGVTIGVGALVIVMGVVNGMSTDMREKLIGVTSHAIVFNVGGFPPDLGPVQNAIEAVPGVTATMPFIYSQMMISSSTGGTGVIARGIDPVVAPKVMKIFNHMEEGSVEALAKPGALPGIIIGKELARRLSLHVGSRVHIMVPSGQQSTTGFNPKIRPFRVEGVFSTHAFDQDLTLAFLSLDSARELLNYPPNHLTGIEIAVEDTFKARELAEQIIAKLGPPFSIQTWMEMYPQLYAALKLEKAALAVLLTLIVMVGAFSIITALVMLVMEKTRDIAILMSMGATSQSVRRIFMIQGVVIGGAGTAAGFAIGLLGCFLLSRYKFIELPKGIYPVDYLPVLLEWPDLMLTGVCSLLLCFLATLYPSFKAARLEPVEALRQE